LYRLGCGGREMSFASVSGTDATVDFFAERATGNSLEV